MIGLFLNSYICFNKSYFFKSLNLSLIFFVFFIYSILLFSFGIFIKVAIFFFIFLNWFYSNNLKNSGSSSELFFRWIWWDISLSFLIFLSWGLIRFYIISFIWFERISWSSSYLPSSESLMCIIISPFKLFKCPWSLSFFRIIRFWILFYSFYLIDDFFLFLRMIEIFSS